MSTKKKKEEPKIIAVKGFSKDWKCRDFQFEVDKTFTHEGTVAACSSGFHSVEYPLDVFGYYSPADSVYAEVEAFGEISRHNGDTKIASANIIIKAELHIPEVVSRSVNWILARIENTQVEANTGDRSAATNTGYQSAATNTGYRSAATNTGDRSAATNTGNQSAATNTGDQSAATNTGDQSAATNTGCRSAAIVEGKKSIAIATGYASKAKACEGSAIVLVNRDDEWNIRHIRAAKVGEHGIKADTFYVLNDAGEFEEA